MQLSLRNLENLSSRYESMKKRVERVRDEAKETIGIMVQTMEVTTAAFSLGVANGRWNNPEVIGVPVPVIFALGLHGAGFLLDDGAKHLHNLGDGSFAAYATTLGTGIGGKMRLEALNPSGAPVAQS